MLGDISEHNIAWAFVFLGKALDAEGKPRKMSTIMVGKGYKWEEVLFREGEPFRIDSAQESSTLRVFESEISCRNLRLL